MDHIITKYTIQQRVRRHSICGKNKQVERTDLDDGCGAHDERIAGKLHGD